MQIVFSLAGLLIGLYLGAASGAVLGASIGALLGWCFFELGSLQDQITRLEQLLANVKTPEQPVTADPIDTPSSAPSQIVEPTPRTGWETEPASLASVASPDTGAVPQGPPSQPLKHPDRLAQVLELAKSWLTTGNVPAKVGVIVSFFGVAFLFKYAVDRQLLLLSIELRLVAVSIFGMALLTSGWRLRERLPSYALSLQGGGVGILYLTIFAAMRFYELLPAGLGFVLLIALTGFSGVLSVLQDSRALAILGAVGGFLAPFLVSIGTGNHVMLFSYYLVLNAAILGIAWFRPWRELNIIGFVFTFVIGGVWGYENYRPELFASTEPFLLAYFVFYQSVAILFANRQEPNLKGVVDGTLVFGTPVVAFALQARLVENFEYGLAISAMVVALLYAGTAVALFRARSSQFRLLVESFLALAVAFATISIPLALDARWTAAAWALEGAALVWIGVRQGRWLAKLTGPVLLVGAGIAFANFGWQDGIGLPIFNGNYLGGMLISLSALFAARYFERSSGAVGGFQHIASRTLFFWGIAWCLGTGIMEIDDRATGGYETTMFIAYLAIVTALLLLVSKQLNWRIAGATVLAYLPTLLLPATVMAINGEHPTALLGWVVWPLAFGLQYVALWTLREHFQSQIAALHALSLLAITGLAMWEVAWQIDQLTVGRVWLWVAVSLVPGIALYVARSLYKRIQWLVVQDLAPYMTAACSVLVIMQIGIIVALNTQSNGNPAPLPYIPLLNPLDIATAIALILGLRWLFTVRQTVKWMTRDDLPVGLGALAVVALATSTAALIRALHHIGDIPWDFDLLFRSVLIQSALSIYWGILGFTGMVWGARVRQRSIWLVGAGLMATVVIKLFVIDLGNTGTVERIVSFIGTGALLLIVGYFAPVPPRDSTEPFGDQQLENA
jgi:uncharacterized membrane protein